MRQFLALVLAAALPDAEVRQGLAVRGTMAQSDPEAMEAAVSEWLNGLGIGQ